MWRGRTGDGKKSRIVELSIRLMECKFVCFFFSVSFSRKILCVCSLHNFFFVDFIIRLRSWNIWNALKYYIKFQFSHHDRGEGLCATWCVRGVKILTRKVCTHIEFIRRVQKSSLELVRLKLCCMLCWWITNKHWKKRVYFVQTLREELAAEWEMENAIQLKFFFNDFQFFSWFLFHTNM